jgi:nitrogen fixation NifU-like protein
LTRSTAMKPIDEIDLITHLESPHHRGRLVDPTCTHLERNPVCGDWVCLELRLDGGGRIEAAYFEGGGCIISQAAASLLCEHIEGRTLPELASFQAKDMLALIDIPLTPRRQQCGLLAFRALKAIVYSHIR